MEESGSKVWREAEQQQNNGSGGAALVMAWEN
ncbi:hypothetical protein COLO4_05377 [Corchorus olitorius]|uniref:Uncharacterized protein n=1 Tax=Corchorus olitorius TaxID=93759 RepID=A0A1R3KR22_9ROSI|nr:hypothetical protein COLO4_05377 [Corchorus olitorius]